MTDSPSAERRRFGMHANLLYDVITKQAGTLQKAILEGVMNGVDAGATRIEITLTHETLIISDDGKGFKNRNEIEQFFETFGTPHQEGDARYGRFRMGRGQLMAFGRNIWRTNIFEMAVDIKGRGLDYDLATLATPQPGCTIEIELYDQLLPSDRDSIDRELRSWVAYVDLPVLLNGKQISKPPTETEWDVETPEAWFKLAASRNTLSVYNLGVLVMNAPASRFGTGGTVVSKQRLDVNFARNDVQSNCPIFNRIKAELRKHSDEVVVAKPKMTDAERQHIAERILDKSLSIEDTLDLKVLTDVEGRHYTLRKLASLLAANPNIIATQRGDRVGIRIADARLANVLANDTLERFGADNLTELISQLHALAMAADERLRLCPGTNSHRFATYEFCRCILLAQPRSVGDYEHLISTDFNSIDAKQLKPNEKIKIRALHKASYSIAAALYDRTISVRFTVREVRAGESDLAEAWTDGMTNIWIDRRQLTLLEKGYTGCARLAGLLLHEYMHEGPDTDTHTHDAEFYQRYHDLTLDSDAIGMAAATMMKALADEARRRGRKPGPRIAIFADEEEMLKREGGIGSNVDPIPGDSDPSPELSPPD
ncbi:ATP-binding protein [Rhizorhabdus histidinilytica]|uniref:ATP-binding protein n=1 Tax=Rhizorhabdus histidinilytica TaxID=439228 RepID=UPI001ADA01ED|nr:ATP-binding protein [Rhizorhabdus histidinilytica]